MPTVELDAQDWQYISVLISSDIRRDTQSGLPTLVAMHRPIWEKIQPACEWDFAKRRQ